MCFLKAVVSDRTRGDLHMLICSCTLGVCRQPDIDLALIFQPQKKPSSNIFDEIHNFSYVIDLMQFKQEVFKEMRGAAINATAVTSEVYLLSVLIWYKI